MTELSLIFGTDSKGSTPEERARTSSRIFVRSQVQLALESEEATGRKLTASEALSSFGLDLLRRVAEEGGAGIITNPREPAATLSERRRTMRLSKRSLAAQAGVSVDEITAVETPGEVVPIRRLERIAQALALDERTIGLANTQDDRNFAARLRELRQGDERDEDFVAQLAEAAWVIARQDELSRRLGADRDKKSKISAKSGDYSGQIWLKGYELAERTRRILELDPAAPIESVYALAQDDLGIPVIDTSFEEGIAGATVLNGSARGIALNDVGANRNILVRRMTVAHELGHLLWDPDHQLERVRVDDSADLGQRDIRDSIEARANAFAVALLAPRGAVRALYEKVEDVGEAVVQIVETFGISPAAAVNHLANICDLDARTLSRPRTASVAITRLWESRERQNNLITTHVPKSRGGRFALLTVQAVRRKLISLDTAAAWLKIDQKFLRDFF